MELQASILRAQPRILRVALAMKRLLSLDRGGLGRLELTPIT